MNGILGGPLEVLPEKISADDQDTLRSALKYSLESGEPGFFRDHFAIDSRTGVLQQFAPVQKDRADVFNITVKVRIAYWFQI